MIEELDKVLEVVYGDFDVFFANRLIMLGANTDNADEM